MFFVMFSCNCFIKYMMSKPEDKVQQKFLKNFKTEPGAAHLIERSPRLYDKNYEIGLKIKSFNGCKIIFRCLCPANHSGASIFLK